MVTISSKVSFSLDSSERLDLEWVIREIESFSEPCSLCGSRGIYLDEVILDDKGGRMFVCSDTDYCEEQRHEH